MGGDSLSRFRRLCEETSLKTGDGISTAAIGLARGIKTGAMSRLRKKESVMSAAERLRGVVVGALRDPVSLASNVSNVM